MSARIRNLGKIGIVLGTTLVVTSVACATGAATKWTVWSPQSEKSAVQVAKWTSNVTAAIGDGSWTYKSDGVPASNL